MPRKKKTVSGEDTTGFGFRPGESKEAYRPVSPFSRTGQSGAPKIETEAKALNPSAGISAENTQPSSKDQPSANPAARKSIDRSKRNKDRSVTTQICFAENDDYHQAFLDLCAKHKIDETLAQKILVNQVKKACEYQDPLREPTPLEIKPLKPYRLRIRLPNTYLTAFRKKYDRYEVVTMAEVARSWIAPCLEQSVKNAISFIESRN